MSNLHGISSFAKKDKPRPAGSGGGRTFGGGGRGSIGGLSGNSFSNA